MRTPPKKRINTSADFSPLTDLASAFAGREGPTPPEVPSISAPAGADWKPGRVILRRERAHRGGKTVIVIHDFATHLPISFIEGVAKRVRAACGCGGTVRGRSIEVQGDQPGKIRILLESEGFKVAGIA